MHFLEHRIPISSKMVSMLPLSGSSRATLQGCSLCVCLFVVFISHLSSMTPLKREPGKPLSKKPHSFKIPPIIGHHYFVLKNSITSDKI